MEKSMERTVEDIMIDVSQIPDGIRRMLAADLLKAFRGAKREEAELEKEKAPS